MPKLTVCFSADVDGLRDNKLFDKNISAKFPGAMWVTHLRGQIPNSVEFLTSDVALDRVKGKSLNPRNILLIQHNFDRECNELVARGAKLVLLTMFESPLYASRFYDEVLEISKGTHWLLTFEGLSRGVVNSIHAHFPSFAVNDLTSNSGHIPWSDRKFASMVVGNKYVLTQPFRLTGGTEYCAWWIGKAVRQCFAHRGLSINYEHAAFQLQDRRLEIIEELLRRRKLGLFGDGWDKLYRISPDMRKRIIPLLNGVKVSPVSDKRACLSNFKFNICFENFAAPGYITEKIFDAMLAKTVPVYLGAQDVAKYIPSNAYINASVFNSMSALADYLDTVEVQEATAIIDAGQDFLRSNAGLKYTYESMADRVADKLRAFLENPAR